MNDNEWLISDEGHQWWWWDYVISDHLSLVTLNSSRWSYFTSHDWPVYFGNSCQRMEQLFGGGLDDVVIPIFIELPSGDLANCRRVCKLWRRVVDLILQDDRMLRDGGFFCAVGRWSFELTNFQSICWTLIEEGCNLDTIDHACKHSC